MTFLELVVAATNFLVINLPFLILAVILGFGPGFILGIIVANQFFGHGRTFLETHEEALRQAGEHNAQWNPAHERWEKE
jgi:hypothetical protein